MISLDTLDKLLLEAKRRLKDGGDLSKLRQEYLGRRGLLAEILKTLPEVAEADRPVIGQKANLIKNELEQLLSLQPVTNETEIDLTLPIQLNPHGHEHPVPHLTKRLYRILQRLGFIPFITPEIETEANNFDFLRVAKDHPARDMQDTFWTTDGLVLRTQTTAFQHQALTTLTPPFAVMQSGRVFRNEAEDATHLSELHQLDGFAVTRELTFADLKGTLQFVIQQLFGDDVNIRFRPAYFPFVEPGAEIDIECSHCHSRGCRACSQKGWLELLGCGMTHPDILSAAGLNPVEFQGIAFGMGIERLAMQLWGVGDIREFTKNNPRFLEQLT